MKDKILCLMVAGITYNGFFASLFVHHPITHWIAVEGSGRVKSGNLTFLTDVKVQGNSSGGGYGTFQYQGEQDGLRLGVQVKCVRDFPSDGKNYFAGMAGPIVSGSSQMIGQWAFIGIKDSQEYSRIDGIRVLNTSREKALQLCNQPSTSFPGTFISGAVTIYYDYSDRPWAH